MSALLSPQSTSCTRSTRAPIREKQSELASNVASQLASSVGCVEMIALLLLGVPWVSLGVPWGSLGVGVPWGALALAASILRCRLLDSADRHPNQRVQRPQREHT